MALPCALGHYLSSLQALGCSPTRPFQTSHIHSFILTRRQRHSKVASYLEVLPFTLSLQSIFKQAQVKRELLLVLVSCLLLSWSHVSPSEPSPNHSNDSQPHSHSPSPGSQILTPTNTSCLPTPHEGYNVNLLVLKDLQ